MMDMLADQFYHQTGDNITINRMVLADMLTKQTLHGMSLKDDQEAKKVEQYQCQSVVEGGEVKNCTCGKCF